MSTLTDRLTDAQAMKFIDQVGEMFKSAPKLPDNIKEPIVIFAPYLALIGAVLSLFAGPLVGAFGAFGSLLMLSPMYLLTTLVAVVFLVLQAVLLLMAFQPLKDRRELGWVLLFWSEILGLVQSLVSNLGSVGGILSAIIWSGIWIYVLFQIRSSYKA